MGQEPGEKEVIKNRIKENFGATFPIFSKINVNGPKTHALY